MILRKFILHIIAFLICQIIAHSQPPQRIPYQAIARDASGNTVLSQNIGLRFSIHNLSSTGPIIWQEEQTTTSNALGVIITKLGLTNDLYSIDWAHGDKYLQVEMDISGGTTYLDMGTEQMESVPYSLMAGKAGNGISYVSLTGDTLYLENGSFIVIPGISAANNPNQGIVSNHSCGAQNVHNPELNYGTMTDQEGNVYKTIIIGTQEWMAENLKTSIYRNGNLISNLINQNEWGQTSEANLGAWCYYENNETYACPYGKLYNFYSIQDLRGICPSGWHVPSSVEWQNMFVSVSGSINASPLLLAGGQSFWSSNLFTTNNFGLSGLPSGYRTGSVNFGSFGNIGTTGFWWTSSTLLNDNTNAQLASMELELPYVAISTGSKEYGYSIRCIRD